jgi:hypothetical protein
MFGCKVCTNALIQSLDLPNEGPPCPKRRVMALRRTIPRADGKNAHREGIVTFFDLFDVEEGRMP